MFPAYLQHDVSGGDVHLEHGHAGHRALVRAEPREAALHDDLGLVAAADVGKLLDGQVEALLGRDVLVGLVVHTVVRVQLDHRLNEGLVIKDP